MSNQIKPDECIVVERDGDLMFLRFDTYPSYTGWYYPAKFVGLDPVGVLVGPFTEKRKAFYSQRGIPEPEFNYVQDLEIHEYFSKALKAEPLPAGTHIHVKLTNGGDDKDA